MHTNAGRRARASLGHLPQCAKHCCMTPHPASTTCIMVPGNRRRRCRAGLALNLPSRACRRSVSAALRASSRVRSASSAASAARTRSRSAATSSFSRCACSAAAAPCNARQRDVCWNPRNETERDPVSLHQRARAQLCWLNTWFVRGTSAPAAAPGAARRPGWPPGGPPARRTRPPARAGGAAPPRVPALAPPSRPPPAPPPGLHISKHASLPERSVAPPSILQQPSRQERLFSEMCSACTGHFALL